MNNEQIIKVNDDFTTAFRMLGELFVYCEKLNNQPIDHVDLRNRIKEIIAVLNDPCDALKQAAYFALNPPKAVDLKT